MSDTAATSSANISSPTIDWIRWSLVAAVFGMVGYAYWVQPVGPGLTAYQWLFEHWGNVSNYSHGPLIPLIASFLLWWNVSRHGQSTADWQPYWRAMTASAGVLGLWFVCDCVSPSHEPIAYYYSMMLLPIPLIWQVWTLRAHLRSPEPPALRWGVPIVVVAMLLYYTGVKAVQPRVTVISGILLLYGLVLCFRGRDVLRLVFFPIGFLFLMVPLNFLEDKIGFPLRMMVAKNATIVLNLIGIQAIQRGSGIISPLFRFDVADPCSGIRSLMALTTVTAAYAYVTQHAQWKRWFLFLCAVPLAVLGNMARVISIAIVAQVYGQDAAAKIYHEWSGFILFPVALGAMVLIGVLLNFNYRAFVNHWLQPPAPAAARTSPL
jgi:exosortase